MDGTYPVMKGGAQVGQAEIRRQGLYYEIRCQCAADAQMLELVAAGEGQQKNLGLLFPKGGGLYLEKRMAAKELNLRRAAFYLRPRGQEETLFPLESEKAFPYLEKLERAYLVKRDGKCWLAFREV